MSSRATARAQTVIEPAVSTPQLEEAHTALNAAMFERNGDCEVPNESATGQLINLSELEYTDDLLLKCAVFEMHAQIGTNFFIRYRDQFGDVIKIDAIDESIVARMSDGKERKFKITNHFLAVEREDWLDQLLEGRAPPRPREI